MFIDLNQNFLWFLLMFNFILIICYHHCHGNAATWNMKLLNFIWWTGMLNWYWDEEFLVLISQDKNVILIFELSYPYPRVSLHTISTIKQCSKSTFKIHTQFTSKQCWFNVICYLEFCPCNPGVPLNRLIHLGIRYPCFMVNSCCSHYSIDGMQINYRSICNAFLTMRLKIWLTRLACFSLRLCTASSNTQA